MTPTSSKMNYLFSATGPYNIYNNGSVAIPTNGYTGTATIASPTVNYTTPLSGTQDLIFTKSASNLQGQGWSIDFTLDKSFSTSVMNIQFTTLTSVNYVAGDVAVYIYDKSNSVMITPSVSSVSNSTGAIPNTFVANFAPSYTSTQYRLILHIATVSALAYTLEIDNISVFNQNATLGAAIGNWTAYTLAIKDDTETSVISASPSNATAKYRRVGSNCEVSFTYYHTTTTGTAGTVRYHICLPPGLLIDLTQMSFKSGGNSPQAVGKANGDIGGGNQTVFDVCVGDVITGCGLWFPDLFKSGGTFAMNTTYLGISGTFSVPIQGWGSNINLISDFTEYASNSSTNDGTDTSSFSYGPSGSVGILGVTALSSTTLKRVQFSRVIQPTDKLSIELFRYGQWVDIPLGDQTVPVLPYTYTATAEYGMGLYPTAGASYIDVMFGRYPWYGSTFGGAGGAWNASNFTVTGAKWRVRKISNGNMAEAQVINAQIGNWTPCTLTWNNSGTVVNNLAQWRRVGSNMEIAFFVDFSNSGSASVISFTIPDGKNIDSGLPAYSTQLVGSTMIYYNAGAGFTVVGNQYDTSTTIRFLKAGVAVPVWGSEVGASSQIRGIVSVPISGWGSNINLVSDFQEFAYNTQASINTNDTSSFGYGSQGTAILANTGSTGCYYDVQFLNTIKSTDIIQIELRSILSGTWCAQDEAFVPSLFCKIGTDSVQDGAGSNWYNTGFKLSPLSSTKMRISVTGTYAACGGSALYGGVVTFRTWATLIAASDGYDRWRVRKVSNGNMAETNPNVNVIQPITSIQSTGFTYTIPLIPLQTSIVYIPVACAKSSGSAFNITISNGTSSVLINIPASSPTPTVSAITSTLFCDASGILTLQGDITSSGSNSNGNWIQFADGTMECWGWGYVAGSGGTQAAFYPVFPVDFAIAPIISVSCAGNKLISSGVPTSQYDTPLGSDSNSVVYDNYLATQLHSFRLVFNRGFPSVLNNTAYYIGTWQATGRWR